MNIIETNNLCYRYSRADAVHNLDLTIAAGNIFAFIGPNGAGKTTTIKVLMNLLQPTGGEARVLGVDSRRLGPRERVRIGYVSENQRLPDWMTVRQLLDYCRPFYPTWDRELEAKLLRDFDLPPNCKIKHLSRGMAMKAALLSSLAYRPTLLVLDEPFSGLDPLVRDEFIRGVLEVSQQREWTIFISSHDIGEVEQLADWVGLIDAGRLNFAESIDSLQSRFRRIEVTVGEREPDLASLPPTWLDLGRENHRVRFVESRYSADELARQGRERFGDAAISAHPMTLREIFVALARANRADRKAAAA
ncbi:MAG TPA: ABC transporter ATP-binding protein [Lacunisphaera sp.]|jgi:ABC-2 type transport system ATP-binding protein|nr:ABC transporter ATP-binding protein [Lacunisphaera sp.]